MYIKLILWSEVYKRNMSHHPWKDHTVHVNFSNEHVNVDFKVAQDQPFLKVKVHCEHVAKAAPLRPPVVFGPALFNDSDSYQPDSSENLGTTTGARAGWLGNHGSPRGCFGGVRGDWSRRGVWDFNTF